MNTENILAAAKSWAKENGFKIRAKILKSPPDWVQSEEKSQSSGVMVSVPDFEPEHPNAVPCKIWLSKKGDENYFFHNSQAIDILSFKDKNEIKNSLSDAVDCHYRWTIYDVIEEWADENKYVIDEDTGWANWGSIEYTAYEYGRKNDPNVQECNYPSKIGFTSQGDLSVQRAIGGTWWSLVATGKETKRRRIKLWLDAFAKTGFYSDNIVTHLDIKTAKRVVRTFPNNNINSDIHLYQLESATDEGINELCKYKGTIVFSELSFLALKDEQLAKLIENTKNIHNKHKRKNLVVEIGIFSRDKLTEEICKKILRHPFGDHADQSFYLINKNITEITKKIAGMLSRSSARIEYLNSSVYSVVLQSRKGVSFITP